MTYSQPTGYRLPTTISLTAVSRALERFGLPLWRAEVVRAVAAVSVELLATPNHREQVYAKLSNNQITESDLVLSAVNERGLVHRAAEFLDVGHGLMYRTSALPLPPRLDLRCRAQFMDDPDDPDRPWTYVLFGTEHERLEEVFLQLRGIVPYPLESAHELLDRKPGDAESHEEWDVRNTTWDRVLAPYSRSSPLSLSAPEPQIAFDIAESLKYLDRDAEYAAEGKTTVTAIVKEVAHVLGPQASGDLRDRLTSPIKS